MLSSFRKNKDSDILTEMLPLMEELLRPMRFISDLDAVWDDLSQEDRVGITKSRVYRERDHERAIEALVQELKSKTTRIKSRQYRELRQEMLNFLRDWRTQEPDRVKVLMGLIRKHCEL